MLFRNQRCYGSGGAISGGGTTFATNRNIVAVGDSITEGSVGPPNPYPALLASFYSSTVLNKGHGGYGWVGTGSSSLTPLGATEVDPAKTTPPQTLILFAGTNDLTFGTSNTPTDVFNAFIAYAQARWTAGYLASRTLVPTMLPRDNAPGGGVPAATRSAFNTLLINGAATYGYTICRLDQDSRIGFDSCNLDTTYYYSDQVHPNQSGQNIIASLMEGAMA